MNSSINITRDTILDKVKKSYEKGFIVIPTRQNENGIFKIPLWNGNIKNQRWDFEIFKDKVKNLENYGFGVLIGKQKNGLYLNCLDFDIDKALRGHKDAWKLLTDFFINDTSKLESLEETQSNRFHYFFFTKELLISMKAKNKGWIKYKKINDKETEETPGEIELFTQQNRFVALYEGIIKDFDKEPITLRKIPVLELEEVRKLLKLLNFEVEYLTEEEKLLKEVNKEFKEENKKELKENENLAKIKEHIKKTLKIEDLLKEFSKTFEVVNDTGTRLDCLCPFKPERNSSFKIFNTENGQFWADFHGKHNDYVYPDTVKNKLIGGAEAVIGDIFDIYQIFTGTTFKQALYDLGRRAGIKKEDIDEALNRNKEKSKEKIDLFNLITSQKESILIEIEEAKEPEFLLDLPIVLAEEQATLNMILADAGKGKSILNRCIAGSIVNNDNFVILYFDLEYIASISKQRKFNELQNFDNFHLITPSMIEEVKEQTGIKTTATAVKEIIKSFTENLPDKKFIVFIDSFEDLIFDTSDDKELKRILNGQYLRLPRTTFIISHHIAKDPFKQNAMKFRGSMVIKAKVSSMLYLTTRSKENDFTELFELEILKIRAMYKPVKKITARLDLENFKLENVSFTTNSEEIKILKSAFFILKKEQSLTKTQLIEKIKEQTGKAKEKIREAIDNNLGFFNIEKGEKRAVHFSITTNKSSLDRYLAMLGLGDSSLTETKEELLKELEDIPEDKDLNIEIETDKGTIAKYKLKKTIKNNIYNITDNEALKILEKLKEIKKETTTIMILNDKEDKEVIDFDELFKDDIPDF